MSNNVNVGIVGATGYTGSELARILLRHPFVTLKGISSESYAGQPFSAVHPAFQGICDNLLVPAEQLLADEGVDVFFLALPHGVSMGYVENLKGDDRTIIDLSADFRLNTKPLYDAWYPTSHTYSEGMDRAVYGLPELFAEEIRDASLIGNPGCYPTASILGTAPAVDAGLIEPDIIVDAKSGVTGAGVKPKSTTHFSNVNDDFKAYGLPRHRHTVEIEQALDRLSEDAHRIQFTPHLLPVDRGILATIYCRPTKATTTEQVQNIYKEFYRDAPFIRLRNSPPSIKAVRGTNYCDIYPYYDERSHKLIILSVIDNLVKGAAGQAVQNLNLSVGFEETAGLDHIPIRP